MEDSDVILFLCDYKNGETENQNFPSQFREKLIRVYSKCDLIEENYKKRLTSEDACVVSSTTGEGIEDLKLRITYLCMKK